MAKSNSQSIKRASHQTTSQDKSVRSGKKGCLLLIMLAVAFIVLVYAVMIFCMTKLQNNDAETNAREEIIQCQKSLTAIDENSVQALSKNESCKEMKKQFISRYSHQP